MRMLNFATESRLTGSASLSVLIGLGLYAQGARDGASQARQVADRFHLLQNLRETIEAQLSRVDRPTGRALLPESGEEHVALTTSGPGAPSDVAEHRLRA